MDHCSCHWNMSVGPSQLELQGIIPCPTAAQAQRLEADLHRLFRPLQIRAEWFRYEGHLADLLCLGVIH